MRSEKVLHKLTCAQWVHRTALLGQNKTLLWRAKICRDKEMLDETPGFFSSKQLGINLTKKEQIGTYFSSETGELQKIKSSLRFVSFRKLTLMENSSRKLPTL